MKKSKLIGFLVILLVLVGAGLIYFFNSNKDDGDNVIDNNSSNSISTVSNDKITLIWDSDTKFEISVDEIKDLSYVVKEIKRTNDDEEIIDQYPIKGVTLKDLLLNFDKKIEDLDYIRLTAGDGYSLEVPNHIVHNKDLILAYEIDNMPLKENTKPIRVFIPEEEAMYWVRNLVEISMVALKSNISSQNNNTADKIIFFESLIKNFNAVEYDGNSDQKAIKTSDLFNDIELSESIYLLAVDGFEKNEEFKTFIEQYILTEGVNTPAYRGPDLPRGMHVRDLVWVFSNKTGIFSVNRGLEIFDAHKINDDSGINLLELTKRFNMKTSETYLLEASDGYSVQVTHEDLEKGIVYIRRNGEVYSLFEDLPKNTSVKNLLFITPN